MATTRPPHFRMPLQSVADAASSPSPMETIGFGLRPCPARFSRPQKHAGQEVTI
ncbi:MAG: hypothetical protein QOJ29_649 [Thermoleophilaceae bacterium]|jgi:hypothetical protein|nr:hypothetical protein [Thermoleophilaceae bacterium]